MQPSPHSEHEEALRDQVSAVRLRCVRDIAYFLERACKIRTKDGQLLPFKLRRKQREVVAKVQHLADAGKPIRFISLKARQLGWSTLWEGIVYWLTSLHPNRKAYVVAHDVDAATNLFEMQRVFFEECPSFLRPMRKTDQSQKMVFANPASNAPGNPGLRSSIQIAHAKDLKAGRSSTTHAVHLSEAAFYPEAAGKFMLSIANSVPELPLTVITIESTANGRSGWFYEQWQRAIRGESDYTPVFIAWHDWEEYALPFPDEATRSGFMATASEYEKMLASKLRLTWEQVNWYRYTEKTKCGGDAEQMHQEYPSTPEEAFVYSGRGVVPPFVIASYKSRIAPGEDRLLARAPGGDIVYEASARPNVKCYADRVPGFEYVVGADVAMGLEHQDRSTAAVLCRNTQTVVATFRSDRTDPDRFSEILFLLGERYGWARLAVENNNHGLTTLKGLLDRGYWNLYFRSPPGIGNELTPLQRAGWVTNKQTRPLIVNGVVAAMRDGRIIIPDGDMVQEFEDLVWNDDDPPRPEAGPGRWDDMVFAAAIAWHLHIAGAPIEAPKPTATDFAGPDAYAHRAEMKLIGEYKKTRDGFDSELGSEC